jgi:hypothetical protein
MAYTSQEIVDFLLRNPGMTDEQIVKAMETYGVSPAQMAQAVGLSEGAVGARIAATIPQGSSVTLGDTVIVPKYQTSGSGMDEQVGALESFASSKTTGDINYKAPVGTPVNVYSADGEFLNTVKTKKDQSFFGGLVDAFKDPVVLAALGGAAAGGLFGGAGALGGAGTTGLTLAELGGTAGAGALTAAESAALYGTGASALGTAGVIGSDLAGLSGIPAGTGALTAAEAASLYGTGSALSGAGVIGSDLAGLSGIPAGTGALTAAESAALFGTGGAGLMGTGTGLTVAGTTGLGGSSGLASLGGAPGAGVTLGTAGLGALGTGAGLGTSALTTGGLLGANTLLGGAGLGTTLSGLGAGASLLGTAATGLGANNLANLLSGGLGTAGSLLQMQQSKEAALAAQQRIDAETAAAKQAAQFRPIGMTTRFGTSQFAVDPVTGQLTSAGYTLSPEAKNAQDRLVKLAESGLVQAEGAQQAFAPLQTGAQSLFNLGNQYLAQSPESVAQNYLNQQMQLLQPGRELELANLQNRLQQQGRGGLSVAQGGTMGATTPELQALFNARARQEAELAANAQQLGQRDVLFGSSLLGQGAQTMGQYYGGQQAAYTPYTTALGQVQGLETAAQQPFTMGTNLAQQTSTAGANVGKLGLTGAQLSTNLATSANATANPYAQALMAAGNPNAMFGQALGNVFGGLFS